MTKLLRNFRAKVSLFRNFSTSPFQEKAGYTENCPESIMIVLKLDTQILILLVQYEDSEECSAPRQRNYTSQQECSYTPNFFFYGAPYHFVKSVRFQSNFTIFVRIFVAQGKLQSLDSDTVFKSQERLLTFRVIPGNRLVQKLMSIDKLYS